jgi:protein phosphatase 1 regulatory subunit 7
LSLPKLNDIILGIQTNDIDKIENLDDLENLEELYMQQNFIKKIEGLDNNKK